MIKSSKSIRIIAIFVALLVLNGRVQGKQVNEAEFTYVKNVAETRVKLKVSWLFAIPPVVGRWLWLCKNRGGKNEHKKRN